MFWLNDTPYLMALDGGGGAEIGSVGSRPMLVGETATVSIFHQSINRPEGTEGVNYPIPPSSFRNAALGPETRVGVRRGSWG